MSGVSRRTVKVRVGCLRSDAAAWERVAADRREITRSLDALAMGPFAFGVIDEIRVAQERARVAMADAIAHSVSQAGTIAVTLGRAADAYWQDEVDNVHAQKEIW